jgi:hypothetical protein
MCEPLPIFSVEKTNQGSPLVHWNRERHDSHLRAILRSAFVHHHLMGQSKYVAKVFTSLTNILPGYFQYISQQIIICTSKESVTEDST